VYLGFGLHGVGSSANTLRLGFEGSSGIANPIQVMFGTGDVEIGNTTPTDPGTLLGVGTTNQFTITATGNLATSGNYTQSGTTTNVFGGPVESPVFISEATQSSPSCSTSGSATFSQPVQGPSYKMISIYLNACVGTASYTFPASFAHTPQLLSQSLTTAVVTSISTTAVTVTGSSTTGFADLDGW
jgi:hypothetical protein